MYKGTNLKEIQQKYQERMTDLFNEKIGISVEGLSNKYNPQIEMFAHFKTKSSFHKTKGII